MKKIKRITALVLSIAMVISMLVSTPLTALDAPAEIMPDLSSRTEFYVEFDGFANDYVLNAAEHFTAVRCPHCPPSTCFVTHANNIVNITGRDGPLWLMYSCNTIEVRGGTINRRVPIAGFRSGPWDRLPAERVIFTAPITSGTHIEGLFMGMPNLTSIYGLDLFTNTSNLESMWHIFTSASSLTSLDLSSWDNRNVTEMQNAFFNTPSLREITLGPDFRLCTINWGRPGAPNNANYTGRWIHVGEGTAGNPAGAPALTPDELAQQFDGRDVMVGTWVWEPVCQCSHCTNPNGCIASPNCRIIGSGIISAAIPFQVYTCGHLRIRTDVMGMAMPFAENNVLLYADTLRDNIDVNYLVDPITAEVHIHDLLEQLPYLASGRLKMNTEE